MPTSSFVSRIKSSVCHNTVIIMHDLLVNLLNKIFSWGDESENDMKAQYISHKMREISYSLTLDPTYILVRSQLLTTRNWLLSRSLNLVKQHMLRYYPHFCIALTMFGSMWMFRKLYSPWSLPNSVKLLPITYPSQKLYRVHKIIWDPRSF